MDSELVKRIAYIIKGYAEKNGNVESFAEILYQTLIEYDKLDGFAGDLIIEYETESDSNCRGIMSREDQNVHLYRNGLLKYYRDLASAIPGLFSEKEKLALQYLAYAKVVIHEVEHIKQLVKINNYDKADIESVILKLVHNSGGNVRLAIGYKHMGKAHPEERYADYVAYNSLIDICNILGVDYHKMALLFEVIRDYDLIFGYYLEEEYGSEDIKGKGPTYYCIGRFCSEEELKEFKELLNNSNLSFKERLFLGLELSNEEIESVLKSRERALNELTGSNVNQM